MKLLRDAARHLSVVPPPATTIDRDGNAPAKPRQLGLIGPDAAPVPEPERKNTRNAYGHAWKQFEAFCTVRFERAFPASAKTVKAFLVDGMESDASYATLRLRKAAISRKHRAARFGDPTKDPLVREQWIAFLRDYERKTRPKLGMLAAGVEKVVDVITRDLRGGIDEMPRKLKALRDRALILTIYEGALSASEAALLEWEEIAEADGGLEAMVFSANDAMPRRALLRRGPPQRDSNSALFEWRKQSGISGGPVFREVDRHGLIGETPLMRTTVSRIVKERCADAGVDPKLFAVKSIRRGRAMQGVLDGDSPADALERLGLRPDSAPRVAMELEPTMEARRKGVRRVESLPVGDREGGRNRGL